MGGVDKKSGSEDVAFWPQGVGDKICRRMVERGVWEEFWKQGGCFFGVVGRGMGNIIKSE